MKSRTPLLGVLATVVALVPALVDVPSSEASPTTPPPIGVHDDLGGGLAQGTDTIIVRFEKRQADPSTAAEKVVEQAGGTEAEVTQVVPITADMVAVTVSEDMTGAESEQLGERVESQPGVDTAEPAGTFTAGTTKDTYYPYLWNVASPTKSAYGTNAEAAWATTAGKGSIVGVVDTGIAPHTDLSGSRTSIIGGNVVAGFDFISDTTAAGDGNGRDSDPTDVGNFCKGVATTWHGTHVAGIIAAIRNNGIGVAGVAPEAKIQPLRALGRCGGSEADIISAMRWGAGLSVSGIAAVNPTPVSVLNLSLGGTGTCSTATQSTVDAIAAKGIPIVVSAGNDTKAVSTASPANCKGVIRVGASGFTGALASYSNYGTASLPLTISGQGGSGDSQTDVTAWIVSTYNTGTSTLDTESYMGMVGTSMAAPHVSATAAMLKSLDPTLTVPQITSLLTSTATVLPSPCTTTKCGAGAVNAKAAVAAEVKSMLSAVKPPVLAGTPAAGSTISSTQAGIPSGATVAYQWLRNGASIPGATAASFVLTNTDAGQKISLRSTVTFAAASTSVEPGGAARRFWRFQSGSRPGRLTA